MPVEVCNTKTHSDIELNPPEDKATKFTSHKENTIIHNLYNKLDVNDGDSDKKSETKLCNSTANFSNSNVHNNYETLSSKLPEASKENQIQNSNQSCPTKSDYRTKFRSESSKHEEYDATPTYNYLSVEFDGGKPVTKSISSIDTQSDDVFHNDECLIPDRLPKPNHASDESANAEKTEGSMCSAKYENDDNLVMINPTETISAHNHDCLLSTDICLPHDDECLSNEKSSSSSIVIDNDQSMSSSSGSIFKDLETNKSEKINDSQATMDISIFDEGYKTKLSLPGPSYECISRLRTRKRPLRYSESDVPTPPAIQRPKRKKRIGSAEPVTCPLCGITLRSGELESHYKEELTKLNKYTSKPRKRSPLYSYTSSSSSVDNSINITTDHTGDSSTTMVTPSTSSSSEPANPSSTESASKRHLNFSKDAGWRTYKQIAANIQMRKLGNACFACKDDGTTDCPFCEGPVSDSSPEMFQKHVSSCDGGSVLFGDSDNDEDEEMADNSNAVFEYEWCGQTRYRVTAYMAATGQLHALGTRVEQSTEDEDVNVCDDDEAICGPAQFSENDVINIRDQDVQHSTPIKETSNADVLESPFEQNSPKTNEALQPNTLYPNNSSDSDIDMPSCSYTENSENNFSSSKEKQTSQLLVLNALKERITELEFKNSKAERRLICEVCYSQYEEPSVSIQCWHSFCKRCWLRSMSEKKECPKCKMITRPDQIRRIYL